MTKKTEKNIDRLLINQPTGLWPAGQWIIHNQEISLQETCYICGTTEGHDYKDHKCWLCWRNTNPGALSSPW